MENCFCVLIGSLFFGGAAEGRSRREEHNVTTADDVGRKHFCGDMMDGGVNITQVLLAVLAWSQ